jgi:hypothetical protein
MPDTVCPKPLSVRPSQTPLVARLQSLLCVATCVFALFAPTTCFLHLTVTSNLRISEEHETHAQVNARQSVPEEQRCRSPRRFVSTPVESTDPSFISFSRVHAIRGHVLSNGLRAPLLC